MKKNCYGPYILILIILIIGVLLIIKHFNYFTAIFSNPTRLKEILTSSFGEDFRIYAPLVLIGLQTLQIVFAPFPGHWIGFVAGFIFGAVRGCIYSLIGILLGATIDFWLARLLGRRFLIMFISLEQMRTFDFYVLKYGTIIIFLLLLLPFSPLGDIIYYLAGLTAVPYLFFLFMVILARLPNALFFNLLGANATKLDMSIVLVFMGILAIIGLIFYIRFRNCWEKWLNRVSYLNRWQKD
ncbi:MAG: VTT domain-containing protein [candidate division WOR-3 bacterium]